MPQTPTQLCNSALLKIGGRTVTSYTGDTTKEGELVQEQFPKTLHQMCRSHVWHFLKTFTSLTGTADANTDNWSFVVTLPTNCLRILSVSVERHVIQYERMGNVIYTNDETVMLRYVRKPVLVAIPYSAGPPEVLAVAADEFPDDFAEACACYLAADISVSLTQNADLRTQMLQMYEGLVRQARFNGACELPDQEIQATAWIDSRVSYGDTNPYPTLIA